MPREISRGNIESSPRISIGRAQLALNELPGTRALTYSVCAVAAQNQIRSQRTPAVMRPIRHIARQARPHAIAS